MELVGAVGRLADQHGTRIAYLVDKAWREVPTAVELPHAPPQDLNRVYFRMMTSV